MIVVTTDEIEGVQITRVVGLVRGSTGASHIGRDIMAGLPNQVGGCEEYARCWRCSLGSRPSAA